MSLRSYFEKRRGDQVHLCLASVEIRGTVLHAGDDLVVVQTTPETAMVVPFNAVQFVRETAESIQRDVAA